MEEVLPVFFQTLLTKKQIRNPTVTRLREVFPLTPNPLIDLTKYTCVCVGLQQGVKKFLPLKFVACQQEGLRGHHILRIKGKEIHVTSLTSVKSKILLFDDKLSFTRSVFVLCMDKECAVRLEHIRNRIYLPRCDGFPRALSPKSPIELLMVGQLIATPPKKEESMEEAMLRLRDQIHFWLDHLVRQGTTPEMALGFIRSQVGLEMVGPHSPLVTQMDCEKEETSKVFENAVSFMQGPSHLSDESYPANGEYWGRTVSQHSE